MSVLPRFNLGKSWKLAELTCFFPEVKPRGKERTVILSVMARNYTFAPGEYYHVYARGVEKLPVFRDHGDFNRFMESLYLLNNQAAVNIRDVKNEISRGLTSGDSEDREEQESVFTFEREGTLTHIGAYCLMPNHFHVLIREKDEGGISKFMQKLMTSYTMYFNKKHDRTGAIFGSSFKARHVTGDNHLKYLFAYIHLNPRKVTKELKKYKYSSYPDYLGKKRDEASILEKDAFPNYFEGAMEGEVNEWLTHNVFSEV